MQGSILKAAIFEQSLYSWPHIFILHMDMTLLWWQAGLHVMKNNHLDTDDYASLITVCILGWITLLLHELGHLFATYSSIGIIEFIKHWKEKQNAIQTANKMMRLSSKQKNYLHIMMLIDFLQHDDDYNLSFALKTSRLYSEEGEFVLIYVAYWH